MPTFDNDTWVKIATAAAVIVAAVIAAMLGSYGQLKIKQYENKIQTNKEKENQRLKFYLPLLRFSYELDKRIGHILTTIDTDWLEASHLEKIKRNEGFASNPNEKGYFIISSVYMLACFFGWLEAMKRSSDLTKPFSHKNKFERWLSRFARKAFRVLKIKEKQNAFLFDPDVSTVSKIFQYEELFKQYISSKNLQKPRDACKLHKQFQYSIGDLMLERDGEDNLRCKSFREFYDAYSKDQKFRYWFILLEQLLVDLCGFEPEKDIETQIAMKNDIRPLRLLAIRYWCRVLMKNMSKEIDIQTPPPDKVLEAISPELKAAITSVKIERLESYLLGIRINN